MNFLYNGIVKLTRFGLPPAQESSPQESINMDPFPEPMTLSPILSTETMPQALEYLSVVDSDLARLVQELGTPPLWAREPGFPTLVHIILEQQVSLASARAVSSNWRP